MKKFLTTMLLGLVLFAGTGCDSETSLGECVGVLEEKKPNLRYEYDAGNIILAVIFSQTLVVPAIVIFDSLECPVAKRAE